jgi:hypothetical protein
VEQSAPIGDVVKFTPFKPEVWEMALVLSKIRTNPSYASLRPGRSRLDTFIEGGDVDVALRNVLMACGVPVRLDKYDYNANSGWPERTGALCHWCCHGFEGMPFGIPVARRAGKYHVIGNFCSLECAAASNFDRSRGSDLAWERNMLINELSAAVGNGLVKVTPAPTRELLQQFGGDMDITKFRGMVRRVRLVYPPCMVVELAHDGHATEHAFKQAVEGHIAPVGLGDELIRRAHGLEPVGRLFIAAVLVWMVLHVRRLDTLRRGAGRQPQGGVGTGSISKPAAWAAVAQPPFRLRSSSRGG